MNIQIRNQPEPYHPLRDAIPERPEHLKEFGNTTDPLFLWQKAEAAISDALDRLEPARHVFAPHFNWRGWADARANLAHPNRPRDRQESDPAADWVDFFEDYPAAFYRAWRRLVPGMYSVHKHGGRYHHGEAARRIVACDSYKEWRTATCLQVALTENQLAPLLVQQRITEAELYTLLALAACWWALGALQDLPEEPEQWPRWTLDYIAGLIHDAERWLAEAYRLEEADTRDAEADTRHAETRKAWAADSHRATSAKGGKHPKVSTGILRLAKTLREERKRASCQALFDFAVTRCHTEREIKVDGYTITANADGKLVSTGPDGGPDGQPVGFEAWRKNYMGRKR